jgi:hypothetical protein
MSRRYESFHQIVTFVLETRCQWHHFRAQRTRGEKGPNPATTSVTPVCIYADLIPRPRKTCRRADAEVAGALNV